MFLQIHKRRLKMSWVKASRLVIGFCLCAIALSAARAQDTPQDQNQAANSVGEQAKDQAKPAQDTAGAPEQTNNKNPQRRQPGANDGQPQNLWNQDDFTRAQHSRWYWNNGDAMHNQPLFLASRTHADLQLAAADESLREHLNLPKGQGVVVTWVDPNSTAAQAGIEQNDILLTVGDRSLGKPDDLFERLKEVGEKPVALTLLRAGSRKTIQVQPQIRVTLNPVAAKSEPREFWIGISVTAVEPVLRSQLRLPHPHAVIINQVFPNSPAAKVGIALHEIIVSLDGKVIQDPNEVARAVQAKGQKPMMLELIGKGGKTRTVAVTPERKKNVETSQAGAGGPQSFTSYNVVLPGAVLDYSGANNNIVWPQTLQGGLPDNLSYGWTFPTFPSQGNLLVDPNQRPTSGGAELSKRLDALDAELKQLMKLIQEVQGTVGKADKQPKSSEGAAAKE
jgi:membrane-associated protease RseP (regulator of RpoE activity)